MDGKRSVRSLTGLRRDSEVMYAGSYDTQAGGNVNSKLQFTLTRKIHLLHEHVTKSQYYDMKLI
jgi:hypothetical protein